jgi:hypothetical protein
VVRNNFPIKTENSTFAKMTFNLYDNGKVDHKFVLWSLIIISLNFIIITTTTPTYLSKTMLNDFERKTTFIEMCSLEFQNVLTHILERSENVERFIIFINDNDVTNYDINQLLYSFDLDQTTTIFTKLEYNTVKVLGNLGPQNALIFIIKIFDDIQQIISITSKYPNLIKLIFAYNECKSNGNVNSTADDAVEKSELAKVNIEQFMKSQWNTNKNLYNYFISICMDDGKNSISNKKICSIDYFYYFDPFEFIETEIIESNDYGGEDKAKRERKTNKRSWGKMKVYLLANQTVVDVRQVNKLAGNSFCI